MWKKQVDKKVQKVAGQFYFGNVKDASTGCGRCCLWSRAEVAGGQVGRS